MAPWAHGVTIDGFMSDVQPPAAWQAVELRGNGRLEGCRRHGGTFSGLR
jgi:hypothetical protein